MDDDDKEPMILVCPGCGSSVPGEAKRCPSCGTKVEPKDESDRAIADVDEILEDISSISMETGEAEPVEDGDEVEDEDEDEELELEDEEASDEPLEVGPDEPVVDEEAVDEPLGTELDEPLEDEEGPSEDLGEATEEPLAAEADSEGWSEDEWEEGEEGLSEDEVSEDEVSEESDERSVEADVIEDMPEPPVGARGSRRALSALGLVSTGLTIAAILGTMVILRWDTWINGAEVESIGDNQLRFVYLGAVAVASFIAITIFDAVRQRRKVAG